MEPRETESSLRVKLQHNETKRRRSVILLAAVAKESEVRWMDKLWSLHTPQGLPRGGGRQAAPQTVRCCISQCRCRCRRLPVQRTEMEHWQGVTFTIRIWWRRSNEQRSSALGEEIGRKRALLPAPPPGWSERSARLSAAHPEVRSGRADTTE